MKKYFLPLALPLFFVLSAGNNKANMEDLTVDLMNALETRNFHHVKEVLHEMIPIMKKEIKDGKKLIAQADKGADVGIEDMAEFKVTLAKKEDVLKYTERLMNTSSAAIRAKSSELAEKIDEYVQ
ncbi:MAG: hypothetical protein AAGC88_14190 [Bacteroidota bacterium]